MTDLAVEDQRGWSACSAGLWDPKRQMYAISRGEAKLRHYPFDKPTGVVMVGSGGVAAISS